MPLFGRETKNKNNDTESPPSAEEEKARPGTSGTEMLLVSNRREASKQLEKAQRAENTYKAKKRASAARKDFQSARQHFKESAQHFKAGFAMIISSIKSLPYMYSDKMEARKRDRAMASRKKLEERLAKEKEANGAEDAPDQTASGESEKAT
jgi:hypothetical protein